MPKHARILSHHSRSLLVAVALIAAVAATGCISSSRINNEASTGQQLQDLEKSYRDGILTQKEYERLKKALIRKND